MKQLVNVVLAIVYFNLFLSSAALAQTPNPSGIWSGDGKYYILLVQPDNTDVVFLETDLQSLTVMIGSYNWDTGALDLKGLTPQDDVTVNATITNGTVLNGNQTRGGESVPLNATLTFAHEGSEYDGIWQSSASADAYVVYLSVKIESASMGVMLDLRLSPESSEKVKIYTGLILSGQYSGVRLDNPKALVKLNFTTAKGEYIDTSVRPPVVTGTFDAVKIF
ncbi:hypothetical protein [Thioflexithrix psekupsensis]|uniref:Uncharacterized protein n=1 Tax=Thioflexithrix psekupsensis TaxID=1570016 RepID=A0A251X4Q2_9GAMM|nr:hypothetical protein [Thioflexithrix psekupsensis]OUD12401.1 hypothetical protein TPSD3_14925 [Thioflexithrix psekupsensis]